MEMELVLVLLVAFAASGVSTVTGFGTATMLTPFMALVVDLKTAVVLVAFCHGAGNLSKLWLLVKSVNWRVFFLYGLPSVLAAAAGALLLGVTPVEAITAAFAAFLVLYSAVSLAGKRLELPGRDSTYLAGGLLSGFTSGLIGLGGAIRAMFLTASGLTAEEYVATAASVAVVVDITRVGFYLGQGILGAERLFWVPPLVLAAFLGTLAGRKVLHRLKAETARKAVLVALLLVGLRLLWQTLGP